MSVEREQASAESRLQWLDEELRQTRAALHKVEHELEQALNQIFNLDSGLRKLEEGAGGAGGAAEALHGVQEEIRQLRAQTDKLQDRQNALTGRADEVGRQHQSELERERQERATLLKQAEAAARSVGQFESRIQRLEESLRHTDEAVAELRLNQQGLARDIEELTNRSARNLEAALRLEHEMNSLANRAEELDKRDGTIEEKLSLLEERVHRGEERIDKFEAHLSLPLDIKEQLDRARFERQQMVERLGKVENAASELLEHTAEYVQGLARLEQRAQMQGSRLMELEGEMRQQRETLAEQLTRLVRTMERQRKRQAEALAQEIKELGRSDFKQEQQQQQ